MLEEKYGELIEMLKKGINLNGSYEKYVKIQNLLIDINSDSLDQKYYIKLRIGTRIYEFADGYTRYYSVDGEGYYRTVKSYNAVEKYCLKNNKKINLVKLINKNNKKDVVLFENEKIDQWVS